MTISLARYPQLRRMSLDRLDRRAERVAVAQAIGQLRRVDVRLLALVWQLAGR